MIMKSLVIFTAATVSASLALAEQKPKAKEEKPQAKQTKTEGTQLKDQRDKASYSIGLQIGEGFKRQHLDVDSDIMAAGVRDALSGKPILSQDEVKLTMETFSKEMMEKQSTLMREASAKNLAEGQKFLEEHKKEQGVQTTASGLQYKVLKEGEGEPPKLSDTVTTHYRGTLIDGTEFDSSYKRGEPATFPVSGVIKGWTEALQLMKPGAKLQLAIPPNLAYGERGAGQEIGPNSTLLFDVELLKVNPSATPANSPGASVDAAASPSPSPTAK